MGSALPFVQFFTPARRTAQGALLGFSLPFLPDMLTSRWLSGSNERERLTEALHLQVRLINAFWHMDIAAWDLRFIGTDELPGVAIGLLCRVQQPAKLDPRQFRDYCLTLAKQVQQLFADYGYELLPLSDERSLQRYLAPFQFQGLGEIHKTEKLLVLEDAYTEYEVYVPYPWQWSIQSRLRLFEALLYRQSSCLVSVCLQPTQLTPQEQAHLHHATSLQLKDLLCNSGPQGQVVYNIYADYTRKLRQAYLLRISLAASTPRTVEHIGRIFLDELRTSQVAGTEPHLQYPHDQQEWQRACSNLLNGECLPWGDHMGMNLPATARLRYLVDDSMASMAFRLPVARSGDIPGVPIRSLTPSTSKSAPTGTTGHGFNAATTILSARSTSALPTAGTSSSGALDIQRPEDLVGKTLGSCQIEALLGRGGFGAVYLARQRHLERLVAVKVILATISNVDPQKRHKMEMRFDREAQAVARLDHPHILTLYEYQNAPLPYIVMPYVAGGSLKDEMQASGHRPVPVHGVAAILSQVAGALDHAHQQRLVHRDIKPDNLLRHPDGRILLSDFGIVQFEDGDQTALTTNAQSSPYTPAYASPEQQQSLPVDSRSDIYSLGIVIYELLCGQRPFKVAFQHVHASPPAISSFGVQVHPAVEAVLVKALAKQAAQRYQSAGEMAADFQKAVAYK